MAIIQKRNLQLVIGAKRGRWRVNQGVESADKDFAMVKPRVLSRDKEECVYCSLKIKGMHVHHSNDIHEDNRMENLVTVDDMCHSVNHIGLLGKSGAIVFMPGVSQIEISHLFRTIAVAVSFGGETGDKAKKLAALIISRFGAPIGQIFGTTNPADIGNALLALSDDDYEARSRPFRDVRVVFKPESMTNFASRCRESIYENVPPSDWGRIYEGFKSRVIKE